MSKSISFTLLLCVLLGCNSENNVEPIYKPVDGSGILASVIVSLDRDHPGRGLADYPSNEPVDIPKSYAMILLGAEAEAKSKKYDNINDLGTKAGNWLIENADANNDAVIGWGVPIAWDAYGDGSVNPENTEYAISTAIVVNALLGWLDYVDNEKRVRILNLVEKAFTPYLSEEMRTPSGLLPYSLLPQDRIYDTFNSAVYLAGQMQRYSEIVKDSELKEKLQSAADATMLVLIKNKNVAKNGSWYWNYSIQEKIPNDLCHAGYIIDGILTYIENNGRVASHFNDKNIFRHLMDFIEKDGKIRGWPTFRPDITKPPRLYDLSIAADLMCRFRGQAHGSVFLGEVEKYATHNGGYLKYPLEMEANRQVQEYEAYLYRALISCGYVE